MYGKWQDGGIGKFRSDKKIGNGGNQYTVSFNGNGICVKMVNGEFGNGKSAAAKMVKFQGKTWSVRNQPPQRGGGISTPAVPPLRSDLNME